MKVDQRAGSSARARYEEGLAIWRRRVAPVAALVAAPFIFGGAAVGVYAPSQWRFWGGALFGAGLALLMWMRDTPPAFVEHWKEGAEGERRTARALQPLEKEGWYVFHDLAAQWGNRDHVLVGPQGVFLVDTKSPSGKVELSGDVLVAHRFGNGTFDYRDKLGPKMRGAAAIWAEFPEQTATGDRFSIVSGDRLVDWLRAQPVCLTPERIDSIAAAIRQLEARDQRRLDAAS